MSEIEPVTERDIDEVLNARAAGYDIRYALEQDRRRVAERQAPEIERLRAEVARLTAALNEKENAAKGGKQSGGLRDG